MGPGEAIQIRSLNAISGDVAFLGIPNQRGVELAIADYGPIGGHDVTIGAGMDDLCSADGGQAAAQMIVADQDVVGVIGTSCSGAATAASPLISAAGMVMISGSNTSPALTSDLAGTAGKNYHAGYYRTAHNDLYQGAAAASFALDVLGVSTAAAIHDGDPYTEGLATAFADAFKAGGGTITGFTAVNKGDSDMVPVLTEVAAGTPELLFFPIFQPEGDFIIQQVLTVSGLGDTVMMAADGLLNSNYMALPETEGMYFSGPDVRYGANYNQATGQTGDAFLAAYEAEWGEAPAAPFWAHSYDATTLLLDAIAAASYDDGGTLVIDRAGVREHLNAVTDYSGIIGLISCDAFGDCGSQKITVIGHADSGDVAASNANVVYEYAPGGSSLGEGNLVVPAPRPVFGGTLRVAVEAETDGLNPTVNRFAVSAYQMAGAVFESLTAWDQTGTAVPYLAESITSSDNLMDWDVTLRPGIMFHDGTPVTSEAILLAFQRQLADPLISLALKPMFPVDDPDTDEYELAEIIDDLTVRFHMSRPTASFSSYLVGQLGIVVSPTWLRAAMEDPTLNQAPVGTGPFRFDSRVQDQMTRFVRNDDYWNGDVYLDAVEFYIYTDSEIAADAMSVGDLDVVATSNVDAILSLRDQDGLTLIEDDTGEEGFGMLNTSKAPFNDIRARKALTYATARQDYLEFIGQGILRPADTWFTPEHPFHNPDVVQEADTPDLATPLVADYCTELPENCTDGKINMEFQFSGPSVIQERIYDILSDGWSDHFNITKEMLLQDDHITQVAFGLYDWVTWRQMGVPDPDVDALWLICEAISVLSLNWPRYCDPARDDLLFAQRASTDDDVRAEIWKEVVQMVNQDYTYIIFNHTLWSNAFAPRVKNVCGPESPDGVALMCTVNGSNGVGHLWMEE